MRKQEKLWTKDFVMVAASNFLLFVSYYILMDTLSMYSIEQFQVSGSGCRPADGRELTCDGRKEKTARLRTCPLLRRFPSIFPGHKYWLDAPHPVYSRICLWHILNCNRNDCR